MITSNTARIWVGSIYAYNNGCLIGEWFDIEDWTDADDIEELAKDYIRAHIPEHMQHLDIDDIQEELWCYDTEGLTISGECNIVEAVENYNENRDAANAAGISYDAYVEAVNDGYTIDRDTRLFILPDNDFCYLAQEIGDYDQAGAFADYVDWEHYYSDYELISLCGDWYAIASG